MSGSLTGRLMRGGLSAAALAGVGVFVCVGAMQVRADDPAAAAGRSFAQPALRSSTFPPELPDPNQVAVDKPAVAAPAAKSEPSWPRTLPDAKAEAQPSQLETFTPQEIDTAKARCTAVLKGLDVVVVEETPFKSGSCGTPAPMQLISIGRSPQVVLSPPATVTCDMVAAMHQWVTQDLQSLAKKHLAAQVVGIETMSSYSCRNAYGRKKTNLSEHGRANALDIRSFNTGDARETTVLNDWGPTGWEIRAQIAAAAKAAAAKAAADKIAADKAPKAPQTATTAPAAANPALATGALPQPAPSANSASGIGNLVGSVPAIANRLPGAAPAAEGRSGFGLMKPSNLGGPKTGGEPANVPAADGVSQSRKAQFLRGAHDTACKIFGTTLGPETNLAHKNHFHVDMAERTRGNFCE